jgi:hypothetical protein
MPSLKTVLSWCLWQLEMPRLSSVLFMALVAGGISSGARLMFFFWMFVGTRLTVKDLSLSHFWECQRVWIFDSHCAQSVESFLHWLINSIELSCHAVADHTLNQLWCPTVFLPHVFCMAFWLIRSRMDLFDTNGLVFSHCTLLLKSFNSVVGRS